MNDLPPITFANGDHVPAHARTAPSGVERIMFGENAEKPMARLSYVRLGKKRVSLACCFVRLHLTIGLARPCWVTGAA